MSDFLYRILGAFYAVFYPSVEQVKKVFYDYGFQFNHPQTQEEINTEAVKIARALLGEREGYSLRVYPDPVKGNAAPTVGIGHLVKPEDNLKLGDMITPDRVEQFFNQDIQIALNTAVRDVTELRMYSAEFLAAMISVSFQLGDFRAKGFTNTFNRLKAGKYNEAIAALKQSAWYQQTPKRVNDFIAAIEEWRDTYAARQQTGVS